MNIKEQQEELLQRSRDRQQRMLRVLGNREGEEVLQDLEEHFEVNLPVFQGKAGGFDPLDAMRRDAYREVFLYCRHQLRAARAGTGTNTNHE